MITVVILKQKCRTMIECAIIEGRIEVVVLRSIHVPLCVRNFSRAELDDPLSGQALQDESAAAARMLGETGMADGDR